MKVLFLPRWYPNENDWLDGNFIENHAIALSTHCQIAVLFAVPRLGLSEFYKTEVTKEHGLKVFRVYYRKVNSSIPLVSGGLKVLRYLRALWIGYQAVEKEFGVPQLAHVHVLSRPGLLALWLKWKKKIPYLVTEHWSGYLPLRKGYRGFWKKQLTAQVIKKADCVTTVSNNLAHAMQSHGLKNNYVTVSNVVDTDLFYPGKKQLNGKTVVLHVSTLDEKAKNVAGILNVIKRISEIRNDFEVQIYGAGPDMDLQMNRARQFGLLNKYVFFHGNRPPAEIAEAMRSAHFLILFSNYENQPCVILESLASGLPVISTNVGGIAEVINEKTGVLISPKDENALFDEMIEMMDHPDRYDAQTLRKQAVEHFSKEMVAQQFISLYSKIVSKTDG